VITASIAGAVYLAHEKQEAKPLAEVTPKSKPTATAPLFEVAALHDGQPPTAWLRMFLGLWSER
jgi:hypothetical protein